MTDPFALNSDSPDLVTERGSTMISDTVVAKVAAMAASEVSGVHDLGTAANRTAALRDRIQPAPRPAGQPGISVEVSGTKATVQVGVIAEYGVALHELAQAIRRNVIVSVERMTGLTVTGVNIHIHDIFLGIEDNEPAEV